MKFEKYLASVTHPRGGIYSIAYYADTPNKNYRIYWCGSDTGERFDRLGNASRHLEALARTWEKHSDARIIRQYAARDEIPQRGSNAKKVV
jgi:hypothetical protein